MHDTSMKIALSKFRFVYTKYKLWYLDGMVTNCDEAEEDVKIKMLGRNWLLWSIEFLEIMAGIFLHRGAKHGYKENHKGPANVCKQAKENFLDLLA